MSLDVYLIMEETHTKNGTGIFVREDGSVKEISRAEWEEKFPGREPVIAQSDDDDSEVYSANITHNLNKMATEAGIYYHLWRPDEIGIKYASELIEPLEIGLALLNSDPARFKQFNPSNGWGDYDGFVRFVTNYLHACKEYPGATVSASI